MVKAVETLHSGLIVDEEGDIRPEADITEGGAPMTNEGRIARMGPRNSEYLPPSAKLLLGKNAVNLSELVSAGSLDEEAALNISDASTLLQVAQEERLKALKKGIWEKTRAKHRAQAARLSSYAKSILIDVFDLKPNEVPEDERQLIALAAKLRDPHSVVPAEKPSFQSSANGEKTWDPFDYRERAAGAYKDN